MKKLVLLALTLVSSLAVAQSTPISELQSLLAPISSMKANFKQTVYSERKIEIQSASGNMEYKKPNLFRWQVLKPESSLLVTDGNKIWSYDVALEQVTIQKYTADKQVSPLSFILDDASKLSVNFVVTKPAGSCYQLEPKQDNPNFVNVVVCFNSKNISLVRVLDHLGQTSVFEFTGMQKNIAIANSRFNFVPPAGVDIVGDE
jgi:outer membrane lipoprotein carrier protein